MNNQGDIPESFLERYQCNLVLEGFGFEGQGQLQETSALVIGLGGIGSIVAMYLVANGFGKVGICDYDYVALNNLTRQIIYTVNNIGRSKVEASHEKLLLLNPDVEVVAYPQKVNEENIRMLVDNYNFIIECSDSLETKYLTNKECMVQNKKFLICSAIGYKGNLLTVFNNNSACWECIFENRIPSEIPSCQQLGVFPTVPAIIGLMAVSEIILNINRTKEAGFYSNFISFDLKEHSLRYLKINKHPLCNLHRQ